MQTSDAGTSPVPWWEQARESLHALNNQLAILVGDAEFLRRDEHLPLELQRPADQILEQALAAGELAKIVQTLIKAAANGTSPTSSP